MFRHDDSTKVNRPPCDACGEYCGVVNRMVDQRHARDDCKRRQLNRDAPQRIRVESRAQLDELIRKYQLVTVS